MERLWEENPAILAPPGLLGSQPIELLVQRREQALDGLRGLLHSLSRVKGAASKLPPYVAHAYRARLQHAVGWYRVTTTELVERIAMLRKDQHPTLKKTPNGEWRLVHDPYLVDGANVLLLIGRVDLSYAPMPVAADPMLLLWFSSSAHEWADKDSIPRDVLLPQNMHSILEHARLQRVHELLHTEAQIYGLSPLPTVYEPRDNEPGVACELLLYGSVSRYKAIAKRFRLGLMLLHTRLGAARVIGKMLRGWIVRSQLKAYKAAIKVQAIYRRWRRQARRSSLERTGASALADDDGSRPQLALLPGKPFSFADAAMFKFDELKWERASKLLARKRRIDATVSSAKGEGGGGGGGGGGLLDVVKNASAVATTLTAAEKLKNFGSFKAMKASKDQAAMAAGTAAGPRSAARGNSTAAMLLGLQTAAESTDAVDAEEARVAAAATRIQARMRGVNAQKLVFSLAEAGEEMLDKLRNPRGAEAVTSVCKAYRARNAFSLLLLKAFKQRQMAIVMQGASEGPGQRSTFSEEAWRMAVEAVRERTMQGLTPAEAELQAKVKSHEEHVATRAQFDRMTARLQFWEALKSGTLPHHLSTLDALRESCAVERAEAYLAALRAQRSLPLPDGVSPRLHVSRLVGSVKAIQELVDALGSEVHEIGPLERQLRAHLAHMGVTDPASQEAPPPVASNAGRAMLPTAASQHRLNAVLNALPHPPPKPPAAPRAPRDGGGGGGGGGGAATRKPAPRRRVVGRQHERRRRVVGRRQGRHHRDGGGGGRRRVVAARRRRRRRRRAAAGGAQGGGRGAGGGNRAGRGRADAAARGARATDGAQGGGRAAAVRAQARARRGGAARGARGRPAPPDRVRVAARAPRALLRAGERLVGPPRSRGRLRLPPAAAAAARRVRAARYPVDAGRPRGDGREAAARPLAGHRGDADLPRAGAARAREEGAREGRGGRAAPPDAAGGAPRRERAAGARRRCGGLARHRLARLQGRRGQPRPIPLSGAARARRRRQWRRPWRRRPWRPWRRRRVVRRPL